MVLPLLLACQGTIGDKGQPIGGGNGNGNGNGNPGNDPIDTTQTTAQLCAKLGPSLHVGWTRLRRLTRSEYNHTVRDLLGIADTNPAGAISPDEQIGPFFSNAIAPITDLIVQQHQEAAAKLAVTATSSMAKIAGCDLTADTNDTCAKSFISQFGQRAYRRPLDSGEQQKYLTLYQLGRTNSGASNGFRMVVEAMLQSPFFLYHADVGPNLTPSIMPVALTPYELASRLSYFLWQTMPDKTLFDLAANGQISDPTMLSAQVTRMLADARAADAIPSFHVQWLGIDGLDQTSKDATMFPSFSPALADSMVAETEAFTDYVVRNGDGLLSTLFNASFTIMPDSSLFSLYQMTQPTGFKAGSQVTLDSTKRSGVLTQASFLSAHAHANQTSPVHRGLAVRQNILCEIVPAPPPNVMAAPLPPAAGMTTRDRFAAHESDPMCGTCHKAMDPIGLGFENYDAIGTYRTKENGLDIDNSGEIIDAAGSDAAGTFHGVIELGQKLAASKQVENCVANQWFRFALGRMEANDDACALASIQDGFAASGGNVRDLITKLVLSDAFRYVRSVGAQ